MTLASPRADRTVRHDLPVRAAWDSNGSAQQRRHDFSRPAPLRHPPNYGTLCVKGRFGTDFTTHPRPLKTPLIRTAPRRIPRGPGTRPVVGQRSTQPDRRITTVMPRHLLLCQSHHRRQLRGSEGFGRCAHQQHRHCARLCHAGRSPGSSSPSVQRDEQQLRRNGTPRHVIVDSSNTTETHPVISLFLKKVSGKRRKTHRVDRARSS